VTIIIDTSVALKWVLPEEKTDAALALYGTELAASSIWLAEAANAIWRHVIAGRVQSGDGVEALRRLRESGVSSIPIDLDVTQALALGLRLNHPIYDCLYLAAAIRERSYVVTADERFVAAVRRFDDLGEFIRLLGGD
jgi:predicted nucleic acid-binding protein